MSMNVATAPTSQEYDYTSSGIDNFLARSLDQVTWQTSLGAMLNMPGSESLTTLPTRSNGNQLNLDALMASGSLGNSIQQGSMVVDPQTDTMTLNNGTIQVNG